MANRNDLLFPLLTITKNGTEVYLAFRFEVIKQTNSYSLKCGQYRDAYFIDASGKRYDIYRVKKLRLAKPYAHILLFDPQYEIDFDLSEGVQLSIEEIRQLVVAALRKQGIRKKRMFEGIQQAQNTEQVIEVISQGYDGQYGISVPEE